MLNRHQLNELLLPLNYLLNPNSNVIAITIKNYLKFYNFKKKEKKMILIESTSLITNDSVISLKCTSYVIKATTILL